jgi:pantothenate kinase-related protein Tda10
VTNISLDNNQTQSLMYNLDSLINLCIADIEQKERWKQCLEHYKSLFVMLRKREDFSDEEIIEFQKEADLFNKIWIEIHGVKGVTNYIHMIGSGHVADFLEYYKNLYRHSQQGWENF